MEVLHSLLLASATSAIGLSPTGCAPADPSSASASSSGALLIVVVLLCPVAILVLQLSPLAVLLYYVVQAHVDAVWSICLVHGTG